MGSNIYTVVGPQFLNAQNDFCKLDVQPAEILDPILYLQIHRMNRSLLRRVEDILSDDLGQACGFWTVQSQRRSDELWLPAHNCGRLCERCDIIKLSFRRED